MRIFFIFQLVLNFFTAFSQKIINVDKDNLPTNSSLAFSIGGMQFTNVKYVRVIEGSPFFKEEWIKGTVTMSEGKTYSNIPMRLDLMDNNLHFMSKDNKEMIADVPIRNIILKDSVTKSDYIFVHSLYLLEGKNIEPCWYLQLDTGKATLYKRFLKTIVESKQYGHANYEQRILTSGEYYVMIKDVFVPIKKIKQLPSILNNKTEELKKFISANNLSGKSDKNYSALISFYNSLLP